MNIEISEEVKDILCSWMFCSAKRARNKIIPKKVNFLIGNFRREVDQLQDDIEHLCIVVQEAGELAIQGQYGYIDLINEQYLQYNENSSPKAMKFEDFKKKLLAHLKMLRHDFFDKEIEQQDVESAQSSIDEINAIATWAILTDQFDTEEIVDQAQTYMKEMSEILQKVSE